MTTPRHRPTTIQYNSYQCARSQIKRNIRTHRSVARVRGIKNLNLERVGVRCMQFLIRVYNGVGDLGGLDRVFINTRTSMMEVSRPAAIPSALSVTPCFPCFSTGFLPIFFTPLNVQVEQIDDGCRTKFFIIQKGQGSHCVWRVD